MELKLVCGTAWKKMGRNLSTAWAFKDKNYKMAGKAIGSPRKNLWGGMREAGEEPKRPRVSARAQGHESPCAREEDGPM